MRKKKSKAKVLEDAGVIALGPRLHGKRRMTQSRREGGAVILAIRQRSTSEATPEEASALTGSR